MTAAGEKSSRTAGEDACATLEACATKKGGSKALAKGLRVFKFLGSGRILEWKSIREVAGALGLTANEAYGALETLVAEDLAEKSDRGFRQSPQGLTFYALRVQEELGRVAKQLGIRQ